jgi:hypothetical protein
MFKIVEYFQFLKSSSSTIDTFASAYQLFAGVRTNWDKG